MNKEQALGRLTAIEKEAAALRKIIETPERVSKEERFKQLVEGWEYKVDLHKFPTSIFYFKGNKFLMEYDFKSQFCRMNSPAVWEILQSEYLMEDHLTQAFIKKQLEKHFNLKGVTPTKCWITHGKRLEEHFNTIR